MTKIIILCIVGFIASFVDSIAGGGGIITIPAYLASGIPPHLALGTNKFSASFGSVTSSIKFAKSGKINSKLLKFLIPFTFLGSILGVKTVLSINQNFLSTFILVMILIIAIYSIFNKSLGVENKYVSPTKLTLFLGIIMAFSLGFYDGFFGPGTGSFLMFLLIKIFKFDFVNACGNAKILNFVSNITSLFMFALNKQIIYTIGLPVGICMIFGARLGSHLAIKDGPKLIKPIFIIMSVAVAGKLILSFF
jgi:uncharacterized membrane protein YfcA